MNTACTAHTLAHTEGGCCIRAIVHTQLQLQAECQRWVRWSAAVSETGPKPRPCVVLGGMSFCHHGHSRMYPLESFVLTCRFIPVLTSPRPQCFTHSIDSARSSSFQCTSSLCLCVELLAQDLVLRFSSLLHAYHQLSYSQRSARFAPFSHPPLVTASTS